MTKRSALSSFFLPARYLNKGECAAMMKLTVPQVSRPKRPTDDDLRVPQWGLYYGNNHRRVEQPTRRLGGPVRFGQHIGKPLSQALWDDLLFRLGCTFLRIYRNDEVEWGDPQMSGEVRIRLQDGRVVDIDFVPVR